MRNPMPYDAVQQSDRREAVELVPRRIRNVQRVDLAITIDDAARVRE